MAVLIMTDLSRLGGLPMPGGRCIFCGEHLNRTQNDWGLRNTYIGSWYQRDWLTLDSWRFCPNPRCPFDIHLLFTIDRKGTR